MLAAVAAAVLGASCTCGAGALGQAAPGAKDAPLRNAINVGVIVGRRMTVDTISISASGGHGDLIGFAPNVRIDVGVPGVLSEKE